VRPAEPDQVTLPVVQEARSSSGLLDVGRAALFTSALKPWRIVSSASRLPFADRDCRRRCPRPKDIRVSTAATTRQGVDTEVTRSQELTWRSGMHGTGCRLTATCRRRCCLVERAQAPYCTTLWFTTAPSPLKVRFDRSGEASRRDA